MNINNSITVLLYRGIRIIFLVRVTYSLLQGVQNGSGAHQASYICKEFFF
jgi:hypothetical protein